MSTRQHFQVNWIMSLLVFAFQVFIQGEYALCDTQYGGREAGQLSQVQMPDLLAGRTLSLRFKSSIDGSHQPMLMRLPEDYTPAKKWPLLVTLHGLGDGPILAPKIESMVQIGPYGRGSLWYTGLGEKDVFECIEFAKKILAIDDDRVYLCGFSMGGAGTFRLGLKHPHVWAACVPVCGRCDDLYAVENASHVPFWINTGHDDTVLPPEYSRKAYRKAEGIGLADWKYTEYTDMGHSFAIDWPRIEHWLLSKKRSTNPTQISYGTKQPNRCYWLEVTKLDEFGIIARIDASVNGQVINIKTDNISNYKVSLTECPLNISKKIRIVENGQEVFNGYCDESGYFVRMTGGSTIHKHLGCSGPLWDVYSGPCTLVYGTNSADKAVIEAAISCAESFSDPAWMNKVPFKILADKDVTKEDIDNTNLVLFGNTETNTLLAQIADKLPVRMAANSLMVKGKKYSGQDVGFVLIYPNPLNKDRYVTVFAGNSKDSINCFDKIWPRFHSDPRDIDVGIFELTGRDNSVRWRLQKVFDSDWNWQ